MNSGYLNVEGRSLSIFIRFLVLLIILLTSFLKLLLLATASIRIGRSLLRFLVFLARRGDGFAVTGIDVLSISIVCGLICSTRGSIIYRSRSCVLLRRRGVMSIVVIGIV
jgi:hypothetical protein